MDPSLPDVRSRADVDRLHGQRVRLEGRYEVEPIAGSKRLQAVTIVLPDRTRLIRAYRPVVSELGLIDRTVLVVGKVFRDAGEPADVQQVMAPHVRAESIVLAPGTTAITPPPTTVPPPPVVASAAELRGRDDRWVQLHGTLTALAPEPGDDMWARATLELADGAEVAVESVPKSRWAPHLASPVTVVARAAAPPSGALALVDRTAICAGHVKDCPAITR